MLSIENPPPPSSSSDPSCPCSQFPPVNSGSDERVNNLHNKLPLPEEVVVVDLPNPPPPLDHHTTPLHNFSIRDYVFTARNKDIKKNWPFSSKNLQLCLKHGVKEVLPPFQGLDTARNYQSIERCSVENSTTSLARKNSSDFDKEDLEPDYRVPLDSSNVAQLNDNKLAGSCADISSWRSGEENDFPSTTTSVSHSEIESVRDSRQSSSPLDTETLLKPSVDEVEAAGPPVTHKVENNIKPPGKKCRLIVKFGANSDRNSTEDIASNCTSVSESMASKVCPVCKTFSSSSNTTLNAHIDQCLSVESTPKWIPDSKVTRHRIKPRKTRMMADIYLTAPHCTLEELDRRNGTNWATVSSMPQDAEKIENPIEGKKQRLSPKYPEDAADVGPVYIDANGTKLRILSKLNDPAPVAKIVEDSEAGKVVKGSKGVKSFSKKKKKRLAQKHPKYLKPAPRGKKILSKKSHDTQISGGQEGDIGEGKSSGKQHQTKLCDSGAFRTWVCSKRRDFSKKMSVQDGHQTSRCKWHLPQELLIENAQSVSNDSSARLVQKLPNLSIGRNDRMEKPSQKTQVNDEKEQSPGRKRAESGAGTNDNEGRSFSPLKRKVKQLSKGTTFMHDRCVWRTPNSIRNHLSSLRKKMVGTCGDALNNSRTALCTSKKSSQSSHAIVNKAKKFSSFRKNVLSSSSHSSATVSRRSNSKKLSVSKNSQVHFTAEREGLVSWDPEVDKHALLHDHAENQFEDDTMNQVSFGRTTILDNIQEKGPLCTSQREKDLALKRLRTAPDCYGPDEEVLEESSLRVGDDSCAQVHEEGIITEPSSKASGGSARSVEREFYSLNHSSNYRGLLCGAEASSDQAEADFVNDQEIFSVDEVGNDMIRQDTDMEMALDSEIGQGNSFPVVDPIPIPGPPGSFLPSPRDMGSEDFQGNSSLTTSRVQSSPDQNDVVDGDSSDSPISAASTISNSTASRSDFKYPEPLSSVETYAVHERVRMPLTAASIELPVQNTSSAPQATGTVVERAAYDGEYLKLDRISFEKGSFGYKNDQPCCCQRKERVSNSATNYRESQLLKRRKMASATVSAAATKQVAGNSNPRSANSDLRPEIAHPIKCPSSGSENVVLPVIKPSTVPIPSKDPPSTGVRFASRTDFESASPSASNPILRLMGKNLMVVNNEDVPMPHGQVEPHPQNNQQSPQILSFSTVPFGNPHNQDANSFHHIAAQGSVTIARDLRMAVGQGFDIGLSNNFRSHPDSKISQVHAQLPAGMFQDLHAEGGFVISMEPNQYKGDYSFRTRQTRPKSRTNGLPIYNMDNTPNQRKHVDSPAHPMREIIIIDDIPERETVVIHDAPKYTEGWRQNQVISSGNSISTAVGYNQAHVHPFSGYQSQDQSSISESSVACNTSYHHANPAMVAKTSPVKWGCTSEGSVLQQRSPYTPTPSSSGHLRSSTTVYYSPSIS